VKAQRLEKLRSLMGENTTSLISSKANIFYYSGFTSEDARLLITPDKQYIITDSRYTIQAHQQAPEFEIIDISVGYKNIFEKVKSFDIAIEEDNINLREFDKIRDIISVGQNILKKQSQISAPRKIKSEMEIKNIAEAERIGDEAFGYILNKIRPGMSEAEIALELEFFMRKCGASSLSFETISASGKRSAMPHGTASDKLIESGDFLTLDFGCVFEGYCSDMTRTVVVGKASDWQKEIYNVVLKAQLAALETLSAGMKCNEIDKVARDIIAKAGYKENFGHGLGHSVGIEIHEMPSLSPKCDEAIKSGHIFTVEPGIYIENKGGVRIEDLVAVTDNGVINLTNSPKELLEL